MKINISDKNEKKQYEYDDQEILGRGRSAIVYKGKDLTTNEEVAVRQIIEFPPGTDAKTLESRAADFHPSKKVKGVAEIYDSFTRIENVPESSKTRTVVYYIMPVYQGSLYGLTIKKYDPLHQDTLGYSENENKLNREWFKDEEEIAWSCEVLLNVLDTLSGTHTSGIFHGDLRFQNVLVKDGRVYLNDFGFRNDDEGSKSTSTQPSFDERMKRAELYFIPRKGYHGPVEGQSVERDISNVSQAIALGLLTFWEGKPGEIPVFNDKVPQGLADDIDKGRAGKSGDRWKSAGEYRDAVKNRIGQETAFWVEREADDYYRVSTSERYFENRLKDALEDKVKAADGKALEAEALIDHVGSVYDSCLSKLTAYQAGLLQRLGAKAADPKLKAELEKPKQKLEQLLADYIPQIFVKQLQKKLSGDSQQPRNVPLDDLTAIKTLYDKCNARITGPNQAVASSVRGAMKKKVGEYLPKLLEQKLQFWQSQPQLSTSAFMNIAEFYNKAKTEFENIIPKDYREQLDNVMKKYLSKSAPGTGGAGEAAGAGQPQTLWDKFDDRNSQLKRKIDNIDAVLVADEGEVKKRVDDVKTKSGERGRTTTQVVDVQNTLTSVRAQLSAFGSFTLTEDTNSDTYKTNKNSEEIKKKIKKTIESL